MGEYLSSDLGALVSYVAGEELEGKLSLKAPSDGTYYVLGALYNTDLTYIAGTLFGLLIPTGEAYAVNSLTTMTTWEWEEDDENDLDVKLTLNRSNTILGLFLMKMANDEPSLDDDTVVDSISVSLSGPAPSEELDIGSLIGMIIPVMMIAMIIPLVSKSARGEQ